MGSQQYCSCVVMYKLGDNRTFSFLPKATIFRSIFSLRTKCFEKNQISCLPSPDKRLLNMPRFRNPPRIDCPDTKGCLVSFSAWNAAYDDGELLEGNEYYWVREFLLISGNNIL